MELERHFILADLMASFIVPVDHEEVLKRGGVSSSDINLNEYLSSTREYSKLILGPVLIEDMNDLPTVSRPELLGESVAARYDKAYYQVESLDKEINRYMICDALHPAMAPLQVSHEEGMFLIPINLNDIKDHRIDKRTLLTRRNRAIGLPDYVDNYIDWERTGYPYQTEDLIWRLATTLIDDEVLLYAALFMREAMRDFQLLSNDDVVQAINAREQIPDTISDGVRVENAIHNCYKSIEAIYGGN